MIDGMVKVWWGGVSFGHRQFLNTVPGLALGMGAVAKRSVGRIVLALGTRGGSPLPRAGALPGLAWLPADGEGDDLPLAG